MVAATETTAPQEGEYPPPPVFPAELPPRKFTQTWMQRNKFSFKTFFTLHYKSFSLFHRHGPRDLWRRISMWLIMLSRLASLILMFAIFLSGAYLDTGGILVMVVLMLVGVIIFMINAWCVALIGDVTGTRRVVGITVRRHGLDIFVHVMALVHVALTVTCIFWAYYGIALAGIWLVEAIILLIVGLMASKEPVDEYGVGGVGGIRAG